MESENQTGATPVETIVHKCKCPKCGHEHEVTKLEPLSPAGTDIVRD